MKRKHCWIGCRGGDHDSEEPAMQAVTTVGLDIVKSTFQIHGANADGAVVLRQQLWRSFFLSD